MKISKGCLEDAIRAYEDCVPLAEIAGWYGVSRQALWSRFKSEGVETRKGYATRRKLRCFKCGVEYEVRRSEYRQKMRNKRTFCSDVCYHLYMGDSGSAYKRQMQRVAREKVRGVFDLKDGHVVHHVDNNHFNTDLCNLMVFESESDYIRYHHELRDGRVTVEPIFDGGSI